MLQRGNGKTQDIFTIQKSKCERLRCVIYHFSSKL